MDTHMHDEFVDAIVQNWMKRWPLLNPENAVLMADIALTTLRLYDTEKFCQRMISAYLQAPSAVIQEAIPWAVEQAFMNSEIEPR